MSLTSSNLGWSLFSGSTKCSISAMVNSLNFRHQIDGEFHEQLKGAYKQLHEHLYFTYRTRSKPDLGEISLRKERPMEAEAKGILSLLNSKSFLKLRNW